MSKIKEVYFGYDHPLGDWAGYLPYVFITTAKWEKEHPNVEEDLMMLFAPDQKPFVASSAHLGVREKVQNTFFRMARAQSEPVVTWIVEYDTDLSEDTPFDEIRSTFGKLGPYLQEYSDRTFRTVALSSHMHQVKDKGGLRPPHAHIVLNYNPDMEDELQSFLLKSMDL